ncbi:MAG TPA: hypothetical protein VGI53_14570 [Dyella sp.]
MRQAVGCACLLALSMSRMAVAQDFSLHAYIDGRLVGLGESSNALTAAINSRPRSWLRFTGEILHIQGSRSALRSLGLPTRYADTQTQLGVRLIN